jgi:hypothetical protein
MRLRIILFSRCLGVHVGHIFVPVIVANLSTGLKSVSLLGIVLFTKATNVSMFSLTACIFPAMLFFYESVFPFSALSVSTDSHMSSLHSSPMLHDQFVDVAYSHVLLSNHGAGMGRIASLHLMDVTNPPATFAQCMATPRRSGSVTACVAQHGPAWAGVPGLSSAGPLYHGLV